MPDYSTPWESHSVTFEKENYLHPALAGTKLSLSGTKTSATDSGSYESHEQVSSVRERYRRVRSAVHIETAPIARQNTTLPPRSAAMSPLPSMDTTFEL